MIAVILVWDYLGLNNELVLLSRASRYQGSVESYVEAYCRVPFCVSLDPTESLQAFSKDCRNTDTHTLQTSLMVTIMVLLKTVVSFKGKNVIFFHGGKTIKRFTH